MKIIYSKQYLFNLEILADILLIKSFRIELNYFLTIKEQSLYSIVAFLRFVYETNSILVESRLRNFNDFLIVC